MKIRTFWTIFIKILGIWLVIDSLKVIPQSFSSIFYLSSEDTALIYTFAIVSLLFIVAIYVLILWLFLYKTSWLIDKLHLEKDFDEEERIESNIDYSIIIRLATIVIGGLMIADSLPSLCSQLVYYFQMKQTFKENEYSYLIVLYFTKTVIGYLLMTNSRFIADFITKQSTKKNNEEE